MTKGFGQNVGYDALGVPNKYSPVSRIIISLYAFVLTVRVLLFSAAKKVTKNAGQKPKGKTPLVFPAAVSDTFAATPFLPFVEETL